LIQAHSAIEFLFLSRKLSIEFLSHMILELSTMRLWITDDTKNSRENSNLFRVFPEFMKSFLAVETLDS
jgi:hypothetical protein